MFHEWMTLAQARDELRDLLMPNGKPSNESHECPLCRRAAKIYKRKIHSQMAYGLIAFYRDVGSGFGHAPSILNGGYQNSDFARLALWGLVVEEGERREDGGRPGWYRVTADGEQWVNDAIRVQKYVVTYNDRVLRREGEMVSVRDALGAKFRYDELMVGV